MSVRDIVMAAAGGKLLGEDWQYADNLSRSLTEYVSLGSAMCVKDGEFWVFGFPVSGAPVRAASSTDGVNWTFKSNLPIQLTTIKRVIWTGSFFFVYNAAHQAAVSSDGINWTYVLPFGSTGSFGAAAWNGTTLVIGGSTRLAVSTNGIDWTITTNSLVNLSQLWGSSFNGEFEVSALGSTFCVVSRGNKCAISTDGVTWTDKSSALSAAPNWANARPICSFANNSMFFVFGEYATEIAYTYDFNTFYSTTIPNWPTSGISGVYSAIWTGTHFVVGGAGGAANKVAVSEDGITWAYRPTILGFNPSGIAFANNTLCATHSAITLNTPETSCATSTDLSVNWTLRPNMTSHTTVYGIQHVFTVTWGGSFFFVAGNNGRTATSEDGITWSYSHNLTLSTWGVQSVRASTLIGSEIFIAGVGGRIAKTSNGVDWTILTSGTTNELRAIASNGNIHVIAGVSGTIRTSTDGITWVGQTSGTAAQINGIVWSGTQFVAVANTGVTLTSPDGIVWSVGSVGQSQALNSISWSGSQFVTVSGTGKIFTSPDGISWTERTSNITSSINSVVWTGDSFCCVGAGGVVLTSTNGVLWIPQTSNTSETLNSIALGNNKLCAAGNRGCVIIAQ